MAARRFEDLDAWQLAAELRDRVLAGTRNSGWRHRRYVEQLEEAASSGPANVAEGFGHFRPREFARFLRIARASMNETRNHLLDPRAHGFFTAEELKALLALSGRGITASTSLMRYLDSCNGEPPTGWRR